MCIHLLLDYIKIRRSGMIPIKTIIQIILNVLMLVIIVNHIAFNNEKQIYRIVGIKRSRYEIKQSVTKQFTNINIHFFLLKKDTLNVK